jgi:hypothetical protein
VHEGQTFRDCCQKFLSSRDFHFDFFSTKISITKANTPRECLRIFLGKNVKLNENTDNFISALAFFVCAHYLIMTFSVYTAPHSLMRNSYMFTYTSTARYLGCMWGEVRGENFFIYVKFKREITRLNGWQLKTEKGALGSFEAVKENCRRA